MYEIREVQFENQFNRIALRNFTANELDLLMAIASKVREKNTSVVEFDFVELKKMIKLNRKSSNKEFADEIISVNKKLLALNFMFRDNNEIIQFSLFSTFRTNLNDLKLIVTVNKDFVFLLNNLTSNFTRFELDEFVQLKSGYAKECYRRLKQFRKQGWWKVRIDDFRELLDIPEVYRMCHIDSKIFSKIEKELSPIFKNFKVEKIKNGKNVEMIHFTFKPEEVEDTEPEIEYTNPSFFDIYDCQVNEYKNKKFDIFWSLYPRKEAKVSAVEEFKKLDLTEELFQDIMKGLEKWISQKEWKTENGRYIPRATRFLKERRWNDVLINNSEVANFIDTELEELVQKKNFFIDKDKNE